MKILHHYNNTQLSFSLCMCLYHYKVVFIVYTLYIFILGFLEILGEVFSQAGSDFLYNISSYNIQNK